MTHNAGLGKGLKKPLAGKESDAALIESLGRYIEALEGRAAYQQELIGEQQAVIVRQQAVIASLRAIISELRPEIESRMPDAAAEPTEQGREGDKEEI